MAHYRAYIIGVDRHFVRAVEILCPDDDTAKEYASKRSMEHLLRFNRLSDELAKNRVDKEFLPDCERRDNLFPNLNWRYYI